MGLIPVLATLLTVVIYCVFNAQPIHWINNEIVGHRVFWCMNGANDFAYHTGLWWSDWIKPLYTDHVEGTFRLRQFSYLLEMLSFKFWQWLEVGYFRNYTLIALHAANAFLLGRLVFALRRSKFAALTVSLLFLNSGIALATLSYPFRNAKMLAVFLFLLAMLIIVRTQGSIAKSALRNRLSVCTLMFLALLTDEVSLFLLLIALLFVIVRDGVKETFSWRLMLPVGVTLAFLAGFGMYVHWFNVNVAQSPNMVQWQGTYFQKMGGYLTNIKTIKDVGVAFFGYFLRHTFGNWGLSLVGLVGFIGFIGLLSTMRKPASEHVRLIMIVVGILVFKSLVNPHVFTHGSIMPEGTIFPSLLFFNWYYAYPESMLLILILGLCINKGDGHCFSGKTVSVTFIAFASVLLIGASNAWTFRNGPEQLLAYHDFDNPERTKVAKDALQFQTYLKNNPKLTVYASIPTLQTETVTGRVLDAEQNMYNRIFPTMFLKQMESDRVLTSLKNTRGRREYKVKEPVQLRVSDVVYDVMTHFTVDVNALRETHPDVDAQIWNAQQGVRSVRIPVTPETRKVSFFVKGHARITLLVAANPLVQLEQNYGQSYQAMAIDFPPGFIQGPMALTLRIAPTPTSNSIAFWGPFLQTTER